jgi:hypothetical protein
MPRRKKRGLRLPIISLGPLEAMDGDSGILTKGKDEDYVTRIFLILPLDEKEFVQGNYQITHDDWDSPVRIRLYQIEDVSEDPIFIWGRRFRFGANVQLQDLPFSIFADNRAKYPCFCAQIEFPFRLEDWRRKTKHQIEQAKFTGIYSIDKSLALKMLNILFSDNVYPVEVRPLEYEDVTNFLEQYFQKDYPQKPLYQHLTLLDSRNAFEEGIIEYLGDDLWQHVSGLVKEKEGKDINTETDLHEIVMEVIIDVVKHHIENRYWIQPFWDDARRFNREGTKIVIPKQPKKESSIQPTLYLLLYITLTPFGIHVERETNAGVGLLDFKCLYTTKDRIPLSVLIEFKLAHHGDIEHGLTKQLPTYLKANKSNHGVFLVMWFKDEQGMVFNEPKRQTKTEMDARLRQVAESVQRKQGFIISTEIIDASVRPSASKL